jgi:transcriptional regulator with GAF, ATPase, and Fis domain
VNIKLQDFAKRYREGFDAYLSDPDERALSGAYELGRAAVAQDFSVLDLAGAHQDMLLGLLGAGATSRSHVELVRAAGEFFLEAVSAFEVATRALQAVRETALLERRHTTILRQLSTFLADASLALDATGSLDEMLQLVAEHARELTGAERCAARLSADDNVAPLDAVAADDHYPALATQVNELAALYRALKPPSGVLRMTGAELERHRSRETLTAPSKGRWSPRAWLAASLTTLDGRALGLIQVFDKLEGDFSDLDEAVLLQLAQMASAAVERMQLYHRIQS